MTRTDCRITMFRKNVLEWSRKSGRSFPWRVRSEPYRVLVAELMLRRTRAEQVVPVYEAFLDRFPDPSSLASAREEDVHDCLRPLGLAWRVPAFRLMARRLVQEYGGDVPRERTALLSLPGVGEYVARAVRCVAFDESEVLVDTNTVRVAGRYFGIEVHPESRRSKSVQEAVAQLVDHSRPRTSNLALLDFAAKICRPARPECAQCPVASGCTWWEANMSKRLMTEASA